MSLRSLWPRSNIHPPQSFFFGKILALTQEAAFLCPLQICQFFAFRLSPYVLRTCVATERGNWKTI